MVTLLWRLLATSWLMRASAAAGAQGYEAPPAAPPLEAQGKPKYPDGGAEVVQLEPKNPYGHIERQDVQKGGEMSKACRYDDPPWSDCDPFDLSRFRTMHKVSGGRECEGLKNITKHCTPYEFPPGTKWLIDEHRKCIAEMKRLKIMIADLSKYIATLREKGSSLYSSYRTLKKHLDDLKTKLEELKRSKQLGQEKIRAVRAEVEEWKSKARELQDQVDGLGVKYHELQKVHKQGAVRQQECDEDRKRCETEIQSKREALHKLEVENAELKRRIAEASRYKDDLREAKAQMGRVDAQVEKLRDKIEGVDEDLTTCKLDMLSAKSLAQGKDDDDRKDTKMDLTMEMWITHNRTKQKYSAANYEYPATLSRMQYYPTGPPPDQPRCLISYYGVTNETCWYRSDSESAEADFADTLGSHLVEAHWKYFTIPARDQYECDKAAHLHYEFLVNRCRPKHYLPVLSIFRPSEAAKELGTHIYPRPNIPQPGQTNRCWITFLGPRGHCEKKRDQHPLYNSDDTPEGYQTGSGTSKTKCLARAEVWSDHCDTPAIATYLPEGVSTNWKDHHIQHDNHGGRMFESTGYVRNRINAESINPTNLKRPQQQHPEEYEDTPEYRKSLNLQGLEREEILKKLRERLGMKQPRQPQVNPKVQLNDGSGGGQQKWA